MIAVIIYEIVFLRYSNKQISSICCDQGDSLTWFPLHGPIWTVRASSQHNAWTVCKVAKSRRLVSEGPLVGNLTTVSENRGVRQTSTLTFLLLFSQTVILISENHKFIHLPFSLEVKCKGFRTEQASMSVTCQRAAEQKHIGIVSNTDIYIYL